MPSSIARNSCSSLWCALSNVWEALFPNVELSLGNGHSVNFLTDIWVPALGPLWDYSRSSLAAMSHVSFGSVLTDNDASGGGQTIMVLSLNRPMIDVSRLSWRIQIPYGITYGNYMFHSANDAVFVGDSASVEFALSRGIAWTQYYYDGWLQPMPAVSSPPTTTPWSNPEPGCLCLNVDGAVSLRTGKATIGGLLRDTAGNFIFGFSKFIGSTHSLHSELWSLYMSLQLAWDHGVTFLQVQTDCKRVLELLHDPNVESCSISLVRSIHQFWGQA
ncbi:hypothetical protein V6N12_002352 [Hibiscus sabdariffa]|uniref:RNase H type-1 domain-containing protein n=1 Tax=Hibiscus sabdariffa TaxID=183260 RepID=A0ABR2AL66_9ROSI